MRILVTGASGFVGAAFTRLAIGCGHQVAGLSSKPPITLAPGAAGNLTWLNGNLVDAPWAEIERFGPEVCVHLAWIATPGVYLESPENHQLVVWSADFLRRLRATGTNHIVAAGTCIEYRITNALLSETTTPIEPTTTYAHCKNQLRIQLQAEAERERFTFSWGRIFYPYGPGEHPARLCSSLIQKLRRGEPIVLKTPYSTKDYIYIDDLASAILATVEQRYHGAINWGTGEGITVRHLADTIATLLGRPDLVSEVTPPQPDPLGFVVAEGARLRQLGWAASYPLQVALSIMLNCLS